MLTNFLTYDFFSADFHIPVMHNCSWDQSQPIYLHRQIYSCFFPSTRPYENHTCSDSRVLFLWEGGSQSACGFGDDNSCGWNDLVWQCLFKTWWERAPEPLSPHHQNRYTIVYHRIPLIFVVIRCYGFSWHTKVSSF